MTKLNVADGPKMLRETLCVAQARIGNSPYDESRKREHIDRLQRLIDECDRHRPIGPNGKHGNRHTRTCGCDKPKSKQVRRLRQWWADKQAQRDERMGGGAVSMSADTPSPDETYYADVAAYTRGETDGNPYSGERAPVDPATVQIGWVVEVEAHDGSWLVRGEVAASDSSYSPPRVLLHMATTDPCWVYTAKTTVRLVRRAEPEPDPEQVEKLTDILTSIVTEDDDPRQLARALVRRGVTVGGAT